MTIASYAAIAFSFSINSPVPLHLMPRDKADPLLTPGTVFVYRDEAGKDELRVVTKVDAIEKSKRVTIGLRLGDTQTMHEVLVASASGIDRVGVGPGQFGFCQRLAEIPGQAGKEWGMRSSNGWKEFRTAGPMEKVKVPAGTFDAVRVEVTQNVCTDITVKFTEWYAPGVGLVKSVSDDGETLRELKEIRRPKR